MLWRRACAEEPASCGKPSCDRWPGCRRQPPRPPIHRFRSAGSTPNADHALAAVMAIRTATARISPASGLTRGIVQLSVTSLSRRLIVRRKEFVRYAPESFAIMDRGADGARGARRRPPAPFPGETPGTAAAPVSRAAFPRKHRRRYTLAMARYAHHGRKLSPRTAKHRTTGLRAVIKSSSRHRQLRLPPGRQRTGYLSVTVSCGSLFISCSRTADRCALEWERWQAGGRS
jgi:hypothetical protein